MWHDALPTAISAHIPLHYPLRHRFPMPRISYPPGPWIHAWISVRSCSFSNRRTPSSGCACSFFNSLVTMRNEESLEDCTVGTNQLQRTERQYRVMLGVHDV